MQRRHFEFIAEALRETKINSIDAGDQIDWGSIWVFRKALTQTFADALAKTNPNFDRERFLAACRGEDQ